jgi:hypothetical protein
MDPRAALAMVKTRQHAIDFFAARSLNPGAR